MIDLSSADPVAQFPVTGGTLNDTIDFDPLASDTLSVGKSLTLTLTGPGDTAAIGFVVLLVAAACSDDPVMRLCGVNRALEGLAIDVFSSMKEFGESSGDPVLTFCEDWMLADEVTHVKMGSDWLRRLTATDPDRQKQALEFQRAVDKLFSFGGFRGEEEENPIHLARKFRRILSEGGKVLMELIERVLVRR